MNLQNKKIQLKTCIHLAEVMAPFFAPFVEILITDLQHKKYPIVKIYNSQVSGRKEGDSNHVLSYLKGLSKNQIKPIISTWVAPNGNKLKNVIQILFDENEKQIGRAHV